MNPPANAITCEEFATRMAQLGPFEKRPEIAVALSGGVDSMALLVLAQAWLKRCHGRLIALIVDHQLRAESSSEAQTVAKRAAALGIEVEILTWDHDGVRTSVQEQARHARYDLLQMACVRRGILHLLVGHHKDDQTETIAMRKERGSGVRGLAGMSAILELDHCRLLRPLLNWSQAQVQATAKAFDLEWVEDPSNHSQRYWRGAYRNQRPSKPETTDSTILRHQHDAKMAQNLAQHIICHPLGFLMWRMSAFEDLNSDEYLLICGIAAATIGGHDYVRPLKSSKKSAKSKTFAGCLFSTKNQWLFVLREASRIEGPITCSAGDQCVWDRRFVIDNMKNSNAVIAQAQTSGDRQNLKKYSVAQPSMVAQSLPQLSTLEAAHGKPSDVIWYFGAQKPLTQAIFKV